MAAATAPSAIAYLRTSSAANVEGDSSARQRAAIEAYAKHARLRIVGECYDAAVSGADPITERPGFAALLDKIEGNGVRLVLIESADRFARDLLVQETGIAILQQRGVRVVTASGDDLTDSSDPARVMLRQVLGSFAQFEKARVVQKLKGARDRASLQAGRRVEGAKATITGDALATLRRLRRRNPVTKEVRSLREIAAAMAEAGHVSPRTGRPYSPEALRLALGRAAQ
ncbi:recombinase family protein [Roseomonas sp. PWR1]|uniref:Recombinase family protein n=1 Tax=Roseomonas nitratireducens TaxID=2820810 RepID=A0ABS4AP08_9PROT|nr:recombinase family protein [Neoroseomonas nitratireducens]MBP0463095.1 recombinase family protein [Neoroseomonas nitratireducens]